MKKLLFAGLTMMIFGMSCTRETPVTPIDPYTGPKYLTLDTGTIWYYQTNNNIDTTFTADTLISTNRDSVIASKTYHLFEFKDTIGTKLRYFNNAGTDYYQYTSIASQFPAVELKYLNDTDPAGTSWLTPFSFTQNGITFTGNYKYTIEEKNITMTENGQTYSDVIKVRTELIDPAINPAIVTINPIIQDIYAYYAPKYGMIRRQFQLDLSISILGQNQSLVNQNTTEILMSSSIQ